MKFRAFLSRRWRHIVYATTPVLVALLLASGMTSVPSGAGLAVLIATLLLTLLPAVISDGETLSNCGPVVSLLCDLLVITITMTT
ncbi:TPA: hypothetical protein ACW0I5_004486 [Escherichia coli]